jgi:hypothetical protein
LRKLSVLIVVAVCCLPRAVYAQFTDPRNYTIAPVVTNELEIDYSRAHTNGSIDTTLEVVGAQVVINEATLSYTHNFSALGHLAWVRASVPFASVSGTIGGVDIPRSLTGMGDSSLELAALLKGGQTVSAAEFAHYEPATTVGVSLIISVPTGDYDADKLVNLGEHRWSFKPEFGVSYPFGPERRWEVDAYINAYFFTNNTEYRGAQHLRQEPLPGLEGHLSYTFSPSVWASLDLRYSFRGNTILDGLDQNSTQENLTAGAEASWSPDSHNSLVLVLAKALVHRNAPDYAGVALRYIYSWGSGTQ